METDMINKTTHMNQIKHFLTFQISYYFRLHKGFTLIELVIVIAIIAILAVGIIAAINPAEQTNRAADGRFKNTMSEFMSAIQRWHAVNQFTPFCTAVGVNCNQAIGGTINTVDDGVAGAPTVKGKLTAQNEITTNFDTVSTADQAKIYATYVTATNTVSLCFYPSSTSGRADPLANKWCNGTTGGSNPVGCPAVPATANFFCIVQ